MFDIGFGELLLVAVVALVVLGPEKLPRAARFAGLWVRKARAQWNAVKAELENELADEELRRNLREASDAMRDGAAQARGSFDGLRHDIDPQARMMPLAAMPVLPAPMDVYRARAGAVTIQGDLLEPGERHPSALADDPPRPPVDPAQLSLLEPVAPASAAHPVMATDGDADDRA